MSLILIEPVLKVEPSIVKVQDDGHVQSRPIDQIDRYHGL